MIAFYAWTDTLLLNTCRVRRQYFAAERATLFLLDIPRLNKQLVREAEAAGLFDRVVWITPPEAGLSGMAAKAAHLCGSVAYYARIARQMQVVAGEKFDLLCTGGYWAYTPFLFRFLRRANPALQMAVIEEGVVNYGGTAESTWCDAISERRSQLNQLLMYPFVLTKARAQLKTLYLSCPEACLTNDGASVESIAGELVDERVFTVPADWPQTLALYREKRVLFFVQPESREDSRLTERLLRRLIDRFGAENILVRLHPDEPNALDGMALPDTLTVDRSRMLFEYVLDRIDWSDKLLVTRSSSCAFYPRFMRGQEPRICILHRLYGTGTELLIHRAALRLRSLCAEPACVAIPENDAELDAWLDQIH